MTREEELRMTKNTRDKTIKETFLKVLHDNFSRSQLRFMLGDCLKIVRNRNLSHDGA